MQEEDQINISSFDESYYIQHKIEEQKNKNRKETITMDSFNLISIIGKGAYAKVALVRKKDDGKIYAMKILKKNYIEKKDQKQRVWEERKVLEETCNQFVIKMKYAFQDHKKLFFVLEYCPGGELFNILSMKQYFSEEQTKFYTAQMILALKYLHSKNIVYRDLKPENILIDEHGYIKLADFGLSKRNVVGQEAKSVCGTPEYLAPEVLFRNGHGKPVDFWTLGCIIFEMFTGQPPFQIANQARREELFQKIKFEVIEMPEKVTGHLRNLLQQLFEKNPDRRLGSKKGAEELIEHPWFQGFNWAALTARTMEAPFVPKLKQETDLKYFDPIFVDQPLQSPENENISQNSRQNSIYSRFTYFEEQLSKRQSPIMLDSKENISPTNRIIVDNSTVNPNKIQEQQSIIILGSSSLNGQLCDDNQLQLD